MSLRIPVYARGGVVVAWARVDDVDAHLGEYRWHLGRGGYAIRNAGPVGNRTRIRMHREVLGLRRGDGLEVDHLNRERLDNRRSNLRICDRCTNMQNRDPRGQRGARAGARGVAWREARGKWQASAVVAGRRYYLGLFADRDEAAAVVAAFRRQHMPGAVS